MPPTATAPPEVADKIAERIDSAYVSDEERENPRVMKAKDLCKLQSETAATHVLHG